MIVKEQEFVLPASSVTVLVTMLVPLAKVEPLGGTLTTVAPGQLSPTVGAKVIGSETHWPGAVLVTMFAGQAIVGASRSSTVTVKLQEFVLPAASVTVLVTMLVPLAKVEPLGGTLTTVAPGQLSPTVGANVIGAETHWPGAVLVTMFAGQAIVGASRSTTVTVKLQVLVLLLASTTWNVFVVTPTGKVLPLGRPAICVVVAVGQSGVTTGAVKLTTALHWPAALVAIRLPGQTMAGGLTRSMTTVCTWVAMLPVRSAYVHVTRKVPGRLKEVGSVVAPVISPAQASVAVGVVRVTEHALVRLGSGETSGAGADVSRVTTVRATELVAPLMSTTV
ncbi:MAG: hypothetical protein PCFJNLEI_04023 [Verrucomicrobiae bacterium]|nr:hypothetical protein [Verrucomicrobiae bacterium]